MKMDFIDYVMGFVMGSLGLAIVIGGAYTIYNHQADLADCRARNIPRARCTGSSSAVEYKADVRLR